MFVVYIVLIDPMKRLIYNRARRSEKIMLMVASFEEGTTLAATFPHTQLAFENCDRHGYSDIPTE